LWIDLGQLFENRLDLIGGRLRGGSSVLRPRECPQVAEQLLATPIVLAVGCERRIHAADRLIGHSLGLVHETHRLLPSRW
jgi:hypothetical protein